MLFAHKRNYSHILIFTLAASSVKINVAAKFPFLPFRTLILTFPITLITDCPAALWVLWASLCSYHKSGQFACMCSSFLFFPHFWKIWSNLLYSSCFVTKTCISIFTCIVLATLTAEKAKNVEQKIWTCSKQDSCLGMLRLRYRYWVEMLQI